MGDRDLRNSGQRVRVPDARGETPSAGGAPAEGGQDPAGGSRSRPPRGESMGISRQRSLAGEPRAMERLANAMLDQEHREELIRCGRLLPAEHFTAGEQALLLSELARLAGEAGAPGAVAVYASRGDTAVELALRVPARALSEAAREIIRRRQAGVPEDRR